MTRPFRMALFPLMAILLPALVFAAEASGKRPPPGKTISKEQASALAWEAYGKLTDMAIDAMESITIAGKHTLDFDVPNFARKGDEVWEARAAKLGGPLRGILWVHGSSGQVKGIIGHWGSPRKAPGGALAVAPSWPGEITIRRERRGEALLYVVGFDPGRGDQLLTARPKKYPKVHLAWHRGGEFRGSFFRPGTLSRYTLEPGFAELSFELLPKDDPHIFIFYGEGRKECAPDYVFASRPDSAFLSEPLPVPGDFDASLNELVMDIFRSITERHGKSLSRDK